MQTKGTRGVVENRASCPPPHPGPQTQIYGLGVTECEDCQRCQGSRQRREGRGRGAGLQYTKLQPPTQPPPHTDTHTRTDTHTHTHTDTHDCTHTHTHRHTHTHTHTHLGEGDDTQGASAVMMILIRHPFWHRPPPLGAHPWTHAGLPL